MSENTPTQNPLHAFLPLLRPWQHTPAAQLFQILSSGNNAVDASDCGVGKSYTAMAVAAALRQPTLVCAPKISETQWHQVARHFGDSISFCGHELLRTGRTSYGRWERPPPPDASEREYFQCQSCQCKVDLENYQPCHCHCAGFHCIATKKTAHRYGRFIWSPQVKFLIADEVHRFNSPDSLNADMLIAAKRQGILTLGLSATLANSPLQLRAIGYLLGLHEIDNDGMRGAVGTSNYVVRPSFRRWAGRHKVRPDPATPGRPLRWFAGAEEQNEIMRNIRAEIFPSRGVRISKASIPDFPEVDIQADLYDLEESGKILEIQSEMSDALAQLEARKQLDVAPEAAITVLLRGHQRIELLKVPLAVQLATDYIEKGFSIGLFVNFSQTVDALAEKLNTQCIIDGRQNRLRFRQSNIDRFQENTEHVLIANSAACGLSLSLQDVYGDHPRGGLVFPGYSATVIQQVLGRFPRDGSRSKSFYKVLLAAGTGDEKICRILRGKLNCLESLNDADLLPDNLSFSKR